VISAPSAKALPRRWRRSNNAERTSWCADNLRELVAGMNELAGNQLLDHDHLRREIEARDLQLDNPFAKDAQVMASITLVAIAAIDWCARPSRIAFSIRPMDR